MKYYVFDPLEEQWYGPYYDKGFALFMSAVIIGQVLTAKEGELPE